MKKQILAPVVMSAFLLVTACSHDKKDKKERQSETAAIYSMPVTQEGLTQNTETWPESSKAAITSLNAKYGLPSAVTEDMVVWTSSAPFKRSVVMKDEVNHQFPIQHSDVLLQTVDYRVPLDKVVALSKFDGSLLIDRTKGELSARNDKEEMNILALNLADKIVRGELTVEQARREYSKNAEAFAAGTSGQMLTSLNFQSQGSTSDPDTMMQSQTEGKSRLRKTRESEEVQEVIETEE
jgi:hypothetical protein